MRADIEQTSRRCYCLLHFLFCRSPRTKRSDAVLWQPTFAPPRRNIQPARYMPSGQRKMYKNDGCISADIHRRLFVKKLVLMYTDESHACVGACTDTYTDPDNSGRNIGTRSGGATRRWTRTLLAHAHRYAIWASTTCET